MTTLDRHLAALFRRVRWQDSSGQPICPRCFDGDDLAPATSGRRLESNGAIRRYRCGPCEYTFNDFWGTPLEGTRAPLLLWAYVVVSHPGTRDPLFAELAGHHGLDWARMMARVNHPSPILARWKAALTAAGFTAARLAAALKRRQGRNGRKRRA